MTKSAYPGKTRQKKFYFSIKNEPLYPHLKLTREEFPRLLSTRKIDDDDAEYFGPFLNRSAARILVDFLNRTFRLRTCDIDIDGNFEVPCTQYYAKRCLGPCVKSLCGPAEYREIVELVRLFLRNDRGGFVSESKQLIAKAAYELDFERAAFLRDIQEKIDGFWRDKRRQVWVDGASVDTLVLDQNDEEVKVFLVTTRGRRRLGSRVFVFRRFPGVESEQALADVIGQFYRIHAPREVRVSRDFADRKRLSRELSRKFHRTVKIVVNDEEAARITVVKALERTRVESGLDDLKVVKTVREIGRDFKRIFGLSKIPSRIEGFDTAHISGTAPAAAMSVWQDGKFLNAEYIARLSERSSELDTLRDFIAYRFLEGKSKRPDLIIVDGGRSHVNAASETLSGFPDRKFALAGAVKPRGKHNDVSYFILEDGSRIDYDDDSEAMRILRVLRDDAHELANSAHRQSRDMGYYYELAGILPSLSERERQSMLVRFGSIKRIVELNEIEIRGAVGEAAAAATLRDLHTYKLGKSRKILPLIVPIRYDDPNGEAGDLRPIKSR